ncbi:MAG: hypothetical protein IJ097_03605 [Bacilli bacterium]|nr:hypothetical protein [Bacilli bacterium]
MKKVLLILVLLLFPMIVNAKTPNLEETLKVIKNIENVLVDENIKIESTSVDDNNIIFNINGEKKMIPYEFKNNKFSFTGGSFIINNDKKIVGEIKDNEYAFYLYSILENKSTIPYDINNYYNNDNIIKLVNENYKDNYIEDTNTFGITLKNSANKVTIVYDYYLDGDYPVLEIENLTDDLKNPATGNISLLITIMLISVVLIGAYTCLGSRKE